MSINKNIDTRIKAIDALRGVVMLIMLADHAREYFFLHRQVSDPMDVLATEPMLFLARIAAHLCPAIFIFLSGLSAFLYAERYQADKAMLSRYLFSRGVFLVLLELTLINFAWTFTFPPGIIYLQVIWAIGLSMIALSAMVWLPVCWILAVGLAILLGHNALSPINFAPDSPLYIPWAILHDRSLIALTETLSVRTSYPVLPWMGVIALGYVSGIGFRKISGQTHEVKTYLMISGLMLAAFVLLRYTNIYGESQPWQAYPSVLHTLMSFFNITKYPPSLLFILCTLGLGFGLFACLRYLEMYKGRVVSILSGFGKAPLFFYVVHLYVLHVLYQAALFEFGANQGDRFGFDTVAANWLLAALIAWPLYYACQWFLEFKKTHHYRWLNYV